MEYNWPSPSSASCLRNDSFTAVIRKENKYHIRLNCSRNQNFIEYRVVPGVRLEVLNNNRSFFEEIAPNAYDGEEKLSGTIQEYGLYQKPAQS